MKNNINTINTLDIGSTKICALMAEIEPTSQQPVIRGAGIVSHQGMKKGQIIDIQETTQAIAQAVSAAEKDAGLDMKSCYATLTGDHIRGMDTTGRLSIANHNRPGLGEPRIISQHDMDTIIKKVMEQAMSFPLPIDRRILHFFPKEYIVDDQQGIKNPLNLSGRRLEARAHLTIHSTTATANLTRCINNTGVKVDQFVLHALASAYGCLDPDEKILGTIMLDIGGGTTDVIVYYNDNVYHTGVVSHGSASVTNDIAYLVQVPLNSAEKIKKEYGLAKKSLVDNSREIKIEGLSGRPPVEISQQLLAQYVEARMKEIYQDAFIESQKTNIPFLKTPPIVLTGGGALLQGCEELADETFNSSSRVAYPHKIKELPEGLYNPAYTAAIGLIKFAMQNQPKNDSQLKKSSRGVIQQIKQFVEKVM